MPLTVEQLREEVLALPAEERQRFIASVSDNLPHDAAGFHPAWEEELRYRVDEYDAGRMKAIPWEVVEKELDGLEDLS